MHVKYILNHFHYSLCVHFIFFFIFRLPIQAMKSQIERNLGHLEKANMATSKDHYQSLINAIVQVRVIKVFSFGVFSSNVHENLRGFY